MPTHPTTLGLPHELLLLSLDEQGVDRAHRGYGVEPGLAGALLLELLERGLVTEDGRHLVTAPDAGPVPEGLVGDAFAVIRDSPKARDAKGWIGRFPKELKPLHHLVAHELVERGVVAEERTRFLGLIPRTRYPELDPGPEDALRARLRGVLVDGRPPSAHDAMLIALLRPYDMVKGLVDKSERKVAKRRAEEVAEDGAISKAVGAVLNDAQAAVMAAVVASTVASSAAACSSSSSSNC